MRLVVANQDDPHQLKEEEFHSTVCSFEFWFEAVEGHLHGRPYGVSPEVKEAELTERQRDGLITTLCNYCVGETAALDASSGMVGFAPDRHAKVFLATQVVDEGRHLEILMHRLTQLGVVDPEAEIKARANRSLLRFRDRLLDFVHASDWEGSVFAQNVILECLEFTVFRHHAETADPVTAEMLRGIVSDERRHMGFGENDLGRRLMRAPHTHDRLHKIKRELDGLVLQTFVETLGELGIPPSEQPDLAGDYMAAVARLGFSS
ncbi:MAG: long-chain fatty aldehyde decarbonylase [Hyphomonadaceae bacterium]|nr:long-chain fatty aldehyde decarbonylase [Hyphomonadaceae bacterium]